jgi:hypothetical protein
VSESQNGHVPLDADRREWLERLVAALEHVAAGGNEEDDPYLQTIQQDAEELRARLVAELQAWEPAE